MAIKSRGKKYRLTPVQIITIGFLIIIFTGSILLYLPISSNNGTYTNYLDALFTSTTSVCVTGLVTLNTMLHWSTFGKAVILCLIQVGGLGFMTAVTLLFSVLKKKMSVTNKLTTTSLYNNTAIDNIGITVKKVVLSTFIIELIGACIITLLLLKYFPFVQSFKYGIFTSISAFCNAGLDIMSVNSLILFNSNGMLLWTIMILIVFGGIGFPVWWEIFDIIKKKCIEKKPYKLIKNSISLHFKLVISTTFGLIIIGFLIFLVFEYNNSSTIGNMNFIDKVNNSFFQSITTRTAGFASIDQASLSESSKLLSMLLMFIGGSPGSTAGGIKTVTFITMAIMIYSWLKGKTRAKAFHRYIPEEMVKKAFIITSVSVIILFISILVLLNTEGKDLTTTAFECCSALATVGLSADLTDKLTEIGKLIIIVLMFMGRIGPITLFLSVIKEVKHTAVVYPDEKVILG